MSEQGYFDAEVAATYDRDHGGTDPQTIRDTVACLNKLANGGEALEFAIGTGRIALPLAEAGVPVSGIELSAAMVAEMRKKPGGEEIEVTLGDMTNVKLETTFSLVYLVFNTIDNLTTQEAQIACFENAASHLASGGRFVVETLVPPLQDLPRGETRRIFADTKSHQGFDEFDVVTQQYSSHHVWIDGDTRRMRSIPFRYAWPAELDLMARLAGLEFEHRWADWKRSEFTKNSRSHVSVWTKQ